MRRRTTRTLAPDRPPLNGVQPEIVVKAAGEGDRILLTVADTGPGIPADDRIRAVERFVRLEQSRSLPGSGLGLSLANAVARLHGGELRLEDNAPGLRSVLALPRGASAALLSSPTPPREGDCSSHKCEPCGFSVGGDQIAGIGRARFCATEAERRHGGHRHSRRRRQWGHAGRSAIATRRGSPRLTPRRSASTTGWRELDGQPAGAALRRLFAAHPQARALVLGLADGSPHLWELASPIRRGSPRCSNPIPRRASTRSWPTRCAAISATSDEAEVMRLLRRMKAEASLLIALADIGGVWPVMRVTAALTELADAAVGAAVRHLLDQAAREGKLRPADASEPEVGSGYIVLAMGKMGAGELNYSSDIDLIVFYDASAPTLVGRHRAGAVLRPRSRAAW